MLLAEAQQIGHALVYDSHGALDTIQEGIEASSNSEGSSVDCSEVGKSPSQDHITEDTCKVKWINEDDQDDEVEIKDTPLPDVDGGWAWIVLFSLFVTFIVTTCLLGSTSLYFVQFLDEFNHSRSYTAWIGSLMNSFFMLTGPLSSMYIQKFGFRSSIIFGSLFMCTGCLMSAVAPSLPFLFFSFGTVVAIGQNFIYSGQVIALVEYFHRHHSAATAIAMLGVGVGYFACVPAVDRLIDIYGWRGSFIVLAGVSLQACVFGCLIFNKRSNSQSQSTVDQPMEDAQFHPEFIGRHRVIDKSFSSLRLSIGASYLCTSMASLNGSKNLGSKQHSFTSKGSSYMCDIRSNQHSFSQHDSHYDMSLSPFLKREQLCSVGSHYTLPSIKSDPHNFSLINSQGDLYMPLAILKDHDSKYRRGIGSDISISPEQTPIKNPVRKSKWKVLFKKISILVRCLISSSQLELMSNIMMWLFSFGVFFIMLGTIKILVLYKDLCIHLGVEEYYSAAMICIGIGDMLGRLSAGLICSAKWTSPTICYSLSMLICGLVVSLLLVVQNGVQFLCVTIAFGGTFGAQNVLITMVPGVLFGRDKVVVAFGFTLFWGGIGALIGAPIAGWTVDLTGAYTAVILLSSGSCIFATILMIVCFYISKRKKQDTSTSYIIE